MLTHSIELYKPPVHIPRETESTKFRGEIGSEKHKEFIFDRALQKCKYEVGEMVFWKGKKHQILEIITDPAYVKWDGLSALFVEIWDMDKEFWTVHPSVLKRKLRK